MQDFLEKLYGQEYFGIYLMVAIAILVLLFIIVLFCGKKDKKVREIEATKKLQQVNADAFKQENTVGQVEITAGVPNAVPVNNLNNVAATPNNNEPVEPTPNVETDPIFPTMNTEEEPTDNVVSVPESMPFEVKSVEPPIETQPELTTPIPNVIEENNAMPTFDKPVEDIVAPETIINFNNLDNQEEVKPILDKVEEKPIVFNEINDTKEEVNELNQNNNVFSDIEVPEFKFEPSIEPSTTEEVKNDAKNLEVFSSVFTPEPEVSKEVSSLELPQEKNEEKPEDRVETDIPSEEEMEFELPTLKKEVQEEKKEELTIEKPILNDYNLNDLSGETYDLNK